MLQKMKKISLEKYVLLLLPPSKSLKKILPKYIQPQKKQLFVGIQRQSLYNYIQPCTIFQDV